MDPQEAPSADRPKARSLFASDAVCDECGRTGAFTFAGRTLCEDCYAQSSSCCPEFGKDDLWAKREDTRPDTGRPGR